MGFTSRIVGIAVLFMLCAAAAWAGQSEVLFNGKNLNGWKIQSHPHSTNQWKVGTAKISDADPRELTVDPAGHELINAHGHGLNAYTEKSYGDVVVELEVMVPRGSNSGVYLMGEYEVQVLDSTGKDNKSDVGDMGAIYGIAPPTQPVYRAPGQWNTFRIEFRTPRFDSTGKKIANAKFIRVELNGKVIHENIEVPAPTRACLTGKEHAVGPLMLQGNHGPVSFRNIRMTPLD